MYRRLRYLRETNNLVQQEVADKLNIVKSQYCIYETERVTIPIKHLLVLAELYDVSLDYIFELNDLKKYKNEAKKINKDKMKSRLKEFRKENKLTQKDLASILNTTFSTISSYECGINIISTNFLYAICKKYHISADYLLGLIDTPKKLK